MIIVHSAHATWRPVPYEGLHARQNHRAVLLHTNGGGTDKGSLYGFWTGIARRGQHVGAHFQVATNGHAEQYVDTDQVIYHAFSASEWAVGIETEDDGHPSTPWTDAQLTTIIAICHELHVPGRILTSPQPADGIGWHEQFVDWNHDGHQCPGHVRELQIRRVILPALLASPPAPHPTPSPLPAWYTRVLRCPAGPPYPSGKDVAIVQGKVRVKVDGSYGPNTASHVAKFQRSHNLATDGVVGPATAEALGS